MEKQAQTTQDFIRSTDVRLHNQEASIRNIEKQVGQPAQRINERQNGALRSNIESNPTKNAKVITLRSGKKVEKQNQDEDVVEEKKAEPKQGVKTKTEYKDEPLRSKPSLMPYVPPIPFPERLAKHKQNKQFSKFLDYLKQLHINILL